MNQNVITETVNKAIGANDKVMVTLALIVLVVLCFLCQSYVFPENVTGVTLEEATNEAMNNDFRDGFVFEAMTDWWGNKIHLTRIVNADKTITYKAASAGKDGVFGNKDDLSKTVKSSLLKQN